MSLPLSPALNRHPDRELAVAAVVLWFAVALCASVFGAFEGQRLAPLPLGLAAVAPVVGWAVLYQASARFRAAVRRADLRLVTLAQTWRVGGVVFLILHRHDLLPAAFALPAGWGDVTVGATAPLAYLLLSRGTPVARRLFVLWNLVGLLDLVMAVTLGVLTSATPLGVLHATGGVTSRLMGEFPLSLIPTFFVPLLAILHLVAFARIGAAREAGEQ